VSTDVDAASSLSASTGLAYQPDYPYALSTAVSNASSPSCGWAIVKQSVNPSVEEVAVAISCAVRRKKNLREWDSPAFDVPRQADMGRSGQRTGWPCQNHIVTQRALVTHVTQA
jgi:hypothetical protein